MTQQKVNNAYGALSTLMGFRFPIKKSRALYMMMKIVEDHYNFAIAEEKKCIDELGGVVEENGVIRFETPELATQFKQRSIEISESEIEWDMEPVVLSESDLGDYAISPVDLHNLEGFVSFE